MPRVFFLTGPRQNQSLTIRPGDSVGRDEQCEIHLLTPGVSRRHCQFVLESGRLAICDLGSMNRTYVNGLPITRQILIHNDVIKVGGVDLRFIVEDEEVFTQEPAGGGESDELEAGGGFSETFDDIVDASLMVSNAAMPSLESLEAAHLRGVITAMQRRLTLFYELSQDLSTVQGTNELLTRVMSKLFQVFEQADRGLVMIGDSLESLEARVIQYRTAESAARFHISRNLSRKVYIKRQALLCNDFMAEPESDISGELSSITLSALSHRSYICAPLILQQECFGYLMLDAKGRHQFDREDLNVLAGVAVQAATFLKNDRLNRLTSLERYFSQDLAQQIINGSLDLRPGGDLKSGTVFFSDMIGFTSMSEKLDPHQAITIMNRYFEKMVNVIFKNSGYIDKFIGDAIMAVWGVPVPVEREAIQAITAAIEMQSALYLFNLELVAEGLEPLSMAIGLNSGRFIAGNLGSERRMEYTVLGDAVNLAQRVESKAGRGNLFISEATYERTERCVLASRLKPAAVKGKANEVTIYSVRGIPGDDGVAIMSLPFFTTINGQRVEGQLVKAKVSGRSILSQILLPKNPGVKVLELIFVPQEAPSFPGEFTVQREVPLNERFGACLNGSLKAEGTMLWELLNDGDFVSPRSPDDMPRAEPLSIWQ